MDANSDLSTDTGFLDFVLHCDLHDLHNNDPAPSTYIGSSSRRIDYILGCGKLIQESQLRSGSLSYFVGPQSDHRGLFVDLEIPFLRSALRAQPMTSPSSRILYTGNPELVASSYLKSVREYYKMHQMEERINDLVANHKTMDQQEVQRILTSWDQDQGRAMLSAERKPSKPTKKFAWSPTLRNTAMIRKYWKLRLKEINHQQCYSETFRRWQLVIQRNDPHFTFPFLNEKLSANEIRQHYNAATKSFRKSQRDSTSLRMKTYEDLLHTYTEDDNPATQKESKRKAMVILRTMQTETCRKKFSDLRSVFKPRSVSSLSKILIPTRTPSDSTSNNLHDILRDTRPEELRWETIVNREEMEKHLLTYNREAFRAAASSPCQSFSTGKRTSRRGCPERLARQ